MKAPVLCAIALLLSGVTNANAVEPVKASAASSQVLLSGVYTQFQDASVKAQDDFFLHVNGGWIKTAEIPADKSGAGAFLDLREAVLPNLRTIMEGLAKQHPKAGSEAQKIADLYASFMDSAKIESLGLKPLDADFAKVAALKDKSQLPAFFAFMNTISVTVPFDITVHQDNKDSTKYVLDIGQSGLGMPDRDYYLSDDAKLKDTRNQYVAHIEKMLGLAGSKTAAQDAASIVALETALANIQWSKVELRDPVKAYNKVELSKLNELTPNFDWKPYLSALGVNGKIDSVIVAQPSYISALNKILQETSLDTFKLYFKWHLLSSAAAQLPKAFADENFAFYGTVLSGTPSQEDRWKRAVRLADSAMGESLGRLYVKENFPAESKSRMEKLVSNLLLAYKQSIDTLDWMSADTKKRSASQTGNLYA